MTNRLCSISKRNRPFASRLSKSPLSFFPVWLCHFKELFIPVWREVHRSKILPVTSWQLTNRTVSDNSRPFQHSICQFFFSAWIYNMIETSSPTRSLRDFMHWSSLRSLLRPHKRSTCGKSNLWVAQSLFQSQAKYEGIEIDMKII